MQDQETYLQKQRMSDVILLMSLVHYKTSSTTGNDHKKVCGWHNNYFSKMTTAALMELFPCMYKWYSCCTFSYDLQVCTSHAYLERNLRFLFPTQHVYLKKINTWPLNKQSWNIYCHDMHQTLMMSLTFQEVQLCLLFM